MRVLCNRPNKYGKRTTADNAHPKAEKKKPDYKNVVDAEFKEIK